jgi:hypothetical protein
MRRRLLLLCLAAAVVGCSLPALSFESYRGKAVEAAEEMISQAGSAILAADLAARGRLFGPSVSIQLEDAEEAAAATADDFASLLPPDDRSEGIRRTVLPPLVDATDLITQMRFAAQRGDLDELRQLRSSLQDPVDRLEQLVERSG